MKRGADRIGVLRTRGVQMRLWWTTLLVLIALGGAGLAVAADRPQNPVERPELTWTADRNAQPWFAALAEKLQQVDVDVVKLSGQGRDVLGRITALDVEGTNTALASGDAMASELDSAVGQLTDLHAAALAEIDEWRLGPEARAVFDAMNAAVVSAQHVSADWRGMVTQARLVGGLLDSLLRHDGVVFRATTAGRQSNWDEALSFLGEASTTLDEAARIRDQLAGEVDIDTLEQLLGRYRAYDSALTSLYTYIRDTGKLSGAEFDDRQRRVEQTQAALPADTSALSLIVDEAAGPPLTDALVAIESAHGDIRQAVAAAQPVPTASPNP